MLHPEFIFHQPNILKNTRFKKDIEKLLFFEKIPEKISPIIEKIRLQCLEVYEVLKPLESVGIFFNLALVGGSLRDLVGGNSHCIKDLDILINFSHFPFDNSNKVEPIDLINLLNIDTDLSESIIWPHGQRDKPPFEHWKLAFKKPRRYYVPKGDRISKAKALMKFELVQCLLQKKFNIHKSYPPNVKNDLESNYLNQRLNGVIKIEDDSKYPMDILFADSGARHFIDAFDFDICKIAVQLINGDLVRQNKEVFPQTKEEFLHRIIIERNFIREIKGKKLYINTFDRQIEDVKSSLEHHLPRILKKYPFEVLLDKNTISLLKNKSTTDAHKKRIEYALAYLMARKLDNQLPEKLETKPIKRKI